MLIKTNDKLRVKGLFCYHIITNVIMFQTHLVCTVPPYLDLNIKNPVEAQIVVNSSNRTSEPVTFTYLPC